MSIVETMPLGGYNLEYRQDHKVLVDAFIFANMGEDGEDFIENVYPELPDTVSFSSGLSLNQFTKGAPISGYPIKSTIFTYPGDVPESYPVSFSLSVSDKKYTFSLIAKWIELNSISNGWWKGQVGRHTVATIIKGAAFHELTSPEGDTYTLFSVQPDNTYDINKVNGLADMPLPDGYTYKSYQLEEDFVFKVEQIAYVLADSQLSFQRYPE